MKSEIKKDRQGKEYIAYKVPVVFDLPGYAIRVEIADGETVTVHAGADDQRYAVGNQFADRVKDAVTRAVGEHFNPRPEHYVRCTNDPREIEIAKAGELRKSCNHHDEFVERGVSVCSNYTYVVSGFYRYAYFVEGEAIAMGSDGEPLLKPETVRPIGDIMTREEMIEQHVKRDRERTADRLAAQSWSRDAYNALTFPDACRFALEI